MTNLEIYDAQRGITRDESGKALEITPRGQLVERRACRYADL